MYWNGNYIFNFMKKLAIDMTKIPSGLLIHEPDCPLIYKTSDRYHFNLSNINFDLLQNFAF